MHLTEIHAANPAALNVVPPVEPLADRLQRAHWAYTTRRVDRRRVAALIQDCAPEVGDLVLARIDRIGHHANLHLINGARHHLFPGTEVVVVFGHRYASNQFEAYVPDTLGPCHLVAGGGIAARAASWHTSIRRGPTGITPLGILADTHGHALNLSDFALPAVPTVVSHIPVLAVVGTSMDSGKTQTACHLTRGLIAAGLRVGYGKATGTGAGGDGGWLADAGARPVLDFTDCGLPSTYLARDEVVERVFSRLVAEIENSGADVAVIEIADGVLQRETAHLLRSAAFDDLATGIVLAAQDSMGAVAGFCWLSAECRVPVLALSGVLTAAPLQRREAAAATNLPLHDRAALALATTGRTLVNDALARRYQRCRTENVHG